MQRRRPPHEHFVAGKRSDLVLSDHWGLLFPTNLHRRLRLEDPSDGLSRLYDALGRVDRPVAWLSSDPNFRPPGYSVRWLGPSAVLVPSDSVSIDFDHVGEDAVSYGHWLLSAEPRGLTLRAHHADLLFAYCSYLGLLEISGPAAVRDRLAPVVSRSDEHPACSLGFASGVSRLLFASAPPGGLSLPRALVPSLDLAHDRVLGSAELWAQGRHGYYLSYETEVLNTLARVRRLQGFRGEARALLSLSLALDPSERNFAHDLVLP